MDVTMWLSEDEQRVWRQLLQIRSQLDAHLNRQLHDSSGLSTTDYEVLVPLSEAAGGRLRVFEISQNLHWEQSRLSHHLSRMQRRGLISREHCDTDRRGAFVVLTATGRAAIEHAAPGHADAVRQLVFEGLSAAQITKLRAVSSELLDRLAAAEARPPAVDRERS